MQPIDPTINTREALSLSKKERKASLVMCRFGEFFLKLNIKQQKRFHRIVGSLARHYGISQNQAPMEMILIRQIAMNTIKIEDGEAHIMDNPDKKWVSGVEDFLIKLQKERREAIESLATLAKVGKKRGGIEKY